MTFKSESENRNLAKRHLKAKMFSIFCGAVTWSSVLLLAVLLFQVSVDGFRWLDWQFIDSFPSRFPERAGIKSALVGTIWLIALVALISIPIGVSAALYLEEFAKQGRISKTCRSKYSELGWCALYCLWDSWFSDIRPLSCAREKPCFRSSYHEPVNSPSDNYSEQGSNQDCPCQHQICRILTRSY